MKKLLLSVVISLLTASLATAQDEPDATAAMEEAGEYMGEAESQVGQVTCEVECIAMEFVWAQQYYASIGRTSGEIDDKISDLQIAINVAMVPVTEANARLAAGDILAGNAGDAYRDGMWAACINWSDGAIARYITAMALASAVALSEDELYELWDMIDALAEDTVEV